MFTALRNLGKKGRAFHISVQVYAEKSFYFFARARDFANLREPLQLCLARDPGTVEVWINFADVGGVADVSNIRIAPGEELFAMRGDQEIKGRDAELRARYPVIGQIEALLKTKGSQPPKSLEASMTVLSVRVGDGDEFKLANWAVADVREIAVFETLARESGRGDVKITLERA